MGKAHGLWLYQTLKPVAGNAMGTCMVRTCAELAHHPVPAAPQMTFHLSRCGWVSLPPQWLGLLHTPATAVARGDTCASRLFPLLSGAPDHGRLGSSPQTHVGAHRHRQGHVTCAGTDTHRHRQLYTTHTDTHTPDKQTHMHSHTYTQTQPDTRTHTHTLRHAQAHTRTRLDCTDRLGI